MSSRREDQLLTDIVENAAAIESYLDGLSLDQFAADRKSVDAVERCLARITEASIRIGETRMNEIVPELPMHAVRGLGNLLRHAYEVISVRRIYDTSQEDLPALVRACAAELKKFS